MAWPGLVWPGLAWPGLALPEEFILTPVQRYPLAVGGHTNCAAPKVSYSGVKFPSRDSVRVRVFRQRHDIGLAHDAQGSSVDVGLKERLLETLRSDQRGYGIGYTHRRFGDVSVTLSAPRVVLRLFTKFRMFSSLT